MHMYDSVNVYICGMSVRECVCVCVLSIYVCDLCESECVCVYVCN